MAKTSIIQRELKKENIYKHYSQKRSQLKRDLRKLYKDFVSNNNEIELLQSKLNSLPRNASPSRKTKRCLLTGRPRGVYNRVGLSRSKFREYGMNGEIPGLKKASW